LPGSHVGLVEPDQAEMVVDLAVGAVEQRVGHEPDDMYSAAAIARTMQEHVAIIRACLARDPDAAAAALEHHFAKAMQRALGL
jgi:DNA-binding GntR family transcriptional regulator